VIEPYYKDDSCTIYHGDCREILPELEPVDLVLTDPPYGEQTHGNHLSKMEILGARSALGFKSIGQEEMNMLASEWLEISKGWVVFSCEWHFMAELPELVRFGIWRKPNGAPQFAGDRPGTGWEAIAILHKPGKKKWNGGGKHGFWVANNEPGMHPTQKPLKLLRMLITDFSNSGDLILDPFAGSFTTAVAAKELGRKCIAIEKEEKYCEIGVRRLAQEVLPL